MSTSWSMLRAMWLQKRLGVAALFAVAVLCAGIFSVADLSAWSEDGINFISYAPMGLSIFLAFNLCTFTEADRRARLVGFPARLFTLPVSTPMLLAPPIVFGVASVLAIYALWAKGILPIMQRELPLSWPSLYLSAGMVCYLAIVWALPRSRVTRLILLGIGGTFFQLGWLAFRADFERGMLPWIPAHLPVRPVLCGVLASLIGLAFLVAWISVEIQRRGGTTEWHGWRRLLDFVADKMPGRVARFDSPASAQFWFEWRRHGTLLPLATGCVLLTIMAPAPFIGPIEPGTTMLVLCWILATPLLLAFVLGKGFGKADLWSRDPELPLYLATRPLSNVDWIGAKLKAAALAVVCSWLLLAAMTAVWLWLWCDCRMLVQCWDFTKAHYHGLALYLAPLFVFAVLVFLTWRWLAGSLYVGLCGKPWMLNLSACGVFIVIFGGLFSSIPLAQNPESFRRMLDYSQWFTWILAGLLVAKIAVAASLTYRANQRGLIAAQTVTRYAGIWAIAIVVMIAGIWMLGRFEDRHKWWLTMAVMIAVPMMRLAYAPFALAQSRRR